MNETYYVTLADGNDYPQQAMLTTLDEALGVQAAWEAEYGNGTAPISIVQALAPQETSISIAALKQLANAYIAEEGGGADGGYISPRMKRGIILFVNELLMLTGNDLTMKHGLYE
jgi:hypothetical protein